MIPTQRLRSETRYNYVAELTRDANASVRLTQCRCSPSGSSVWIEGTTSPFIAYGNFRMTRTKRVETAPPRLYELREER